MALEAEVQTILAGDATLTALLTGGVYAFSDLGRDGLTRESAPAAFDSTTGVLVPCAVVRQRSETPVSAIIDEGAGLQSTRKMLEVWVYQDGADGYGTIEAAMARIFVLLHARHVDDTYMLWEGTVRQRDQALGDAGLERADYACHLVRGA